jgi:hypothetical protein
MCGSIVLYTRFFQVLGQNADGVRHIRARQYGKVIQRPNEGSIADTELLEFVNLVRRCGAKMHFGVKGA